MAYTTFKRFSVQAAGSNSGTWGAGGTTGDDVNTGLAGPLDYMLAGISTFSVSGATIALDFVLGGGGAVQNACWRFTGALLQNAVATPNAGNATTFLTGFYYWENVTTGNFSITVTTGSGSVVLPQGRRGVLFIDGTNGPRIMALVGSASADPIPTGTVMLFYQNAAPSGWTISSSLNDYALKIVSSAGGVTSGSVAYSTLFGRTATDSYTLLLADIPSHTHDYQHHNTTGTGGPASGSSGLDSLGTFTTTAAGGGGGHTHGIDMRVQTASVILCSRN